MPRARALTAGPARRWTGPAVLAIGLILFELVRWACVDTGNPNLIPSLLLLGATVVPAAFAAFIYSLDTRFPVAALSIVAMAFLGGVIGVITSGLLEYNTVHRLDVTPLLAVAVIEEAAKLLGPAFALCFVRNRRPATGLILGVASGAGFAVLETLGYSAVALVHSHENLATVDALLLQRGLFSPATHMAWTGLTGAALWSAAHRRWSAPTIAAAAGAFTLAVALHAAWDATNLTGYIALSTLSLSLLAASIYLCLGAPGASTPPARVQAARCVQTRGV